MNFINDKELAGRFKNNTVSAKEKLQYLLACAILSNIAMSSFISSKIHVELESWDIFIDCFNLFITIIGILVCYKTNTDGDNKDFIERFVCLSFPVLIQVALIMLLASLILSFMPAAGMSSESTTIDFFISVPLGLYFYIRLNMMVRIASRR